MIRMGIGDWGLGIGDWGLGGPIPNPQSPINFIKFSTFKFILKYTSFFKLALIV
jgi:hypothetical protein